MPHSRREFLTCSSLAMLASAMQADAQSPAVQSQELPPGAPPAFGTSAPVGPVVSPATFEEAEKLAWLQMTPADRATAASNWRMQMAPLLERRTGPRKIALEAALAPATQWNPSLPGIVKPRHEGNHFLRSSDAGLNLPASDDAIAYSPVWQLSRWIEHRKLTSTRLTGIYLHRLERYNAQLRCVITLLREHALLQAHQADAEIAAGRYRGPLHGIPWGAKDLLDTAGIPTTYGAEPYRNRVPAADATVVERLNAAGAVLVAKLSLGALALNDIWFGGQTMNPWLPEEGSSGSSAGPGAAVAAGLVGFAIGSETGGSIVSPSMRCGVTGLRPTFGRVPRTGAMTLCWSLDKLGPMARSVEDTVLVLKSISGPDGRDLNSVPSELAFDATADVKGLRVGYFPNWMKEAPATDVDRAALETVKKLGMTLVEVSIPDWPYDSLNVILFAEASAAFEDLTLSHHVDDLKMQVAGCLAQLFPPVAFFISSRPGPDGPVPSQGGRGDGACVFRGGSASGAFVAGRNAGDFQLHGAPIADAEGRVCRGLGGTQRLGARPGTPSAQVLSTAPCTAWRHADRAAI